MGCEYKSRFKQAKKYLESRAVRIALAKHIVIRLVFIAAFSFWPLFAAVLVGIIDMYVYDNQGALDKIDNDFLALYFLGFYTTISAYMIYLFIRYFK